MTNWSFFYWKINHLIEKHGIPFFLQNTAFDHMSTKIQIIYLVPFKLLLLLTFNV